jgi:hypothetical protein
MITKIKPLLNMFIPAMTQAIIVCLCSIGNVVADTSESKRLQIPQKLLEEAPEEFRNQFLPRFPPPYRMTKSPGHYCANDWKDAIDSIWGPGPPASVKAERFNIFWYTIDEEYACFQDLDVNWDSIRDLYLSEINDSVVSRGRFAAMMNHAARALKEGHTEFRDAEVYYTEPYPGIPLMLVGGWGVNDHFGAGLTPLPDSTLLVYVAVENHPLGLVPGDIVLGYDGVLWKELYRELLEAELPVSGFWWGSSESSYTHSWLMAAGLNWHLFDTIDVVKYDTKDTLHLATSPLAMSIMSLFATEQMDIPGVPKPDYSSRRLVSWDMVEGTQIGYIYCLGWFWEEVNYWDWYNAIDSLIPGTEGLIIDFRTCYGGNPDWACFGLGLLFDQTVDEIGIDMRADPDDHFAMQPSTIIPSDWFTVYNDPATYYDKPIAVLIGPGCISMGDLSSLLLSFHPMTKLFGKPTTASFNSPDKDSLSPDISFRYARSETYLLNNPGHYLTHDEFPSAEDFPWVSFQEVWLTPDGVAEGKDDVVEAAIAWITSTTDVEDESDEMLPKNFALLQNYPNPFNLSTTIAYNLPLHSHVTIIVYNIAGQQVATLVNEIKPAGSYNVDWDGKDQHGRTVASGVYLYELQAGEYADTKKMLLLK